MSSENINNKPAEFFIEGILSGNIAALSRAITLVESGNEKHREKASQIMQALISKTGNSFRLGITGVPGAGKSTFIESFGKIVIERGNKLAVLAVDPSSARSKGSILGDKTRMETLSAMDGVFIRPSPSSGELGGVARATYETILLCEAAGFNFIIVETVGVGQSEIAVARMCDFFLLLMLAGAGDELQGIKRGIMEMADALAITKADGNNFDKAKAARSEYAHALHLLQAPESGWTTQTHICSGLTGFGMKELYEMMENYQAFTKTNGYFLQKRKKQQYDLFLDSLEEQLKSRFYSDAQVADNIRAIKEAENFQPFTEAKKILSQFLNNNHPGFSK